MQKSQKSKEKINILISLPPQLPGSTLVSRIYFFNSQTETIRNLADFHPANQDFVE